MIEVQGTSVNVLREGRGALLLLVHGNPDSSASWRPLIARLADRYDCIAPDLPGFGRSPVLPNADVSLDGVARWLDEVVDALGLDAPLNLLVHDIGGFVGLAWAVRHPARVRRIIVTNTAFQADYRWHFWARVWRTPGLGEWSMQMLGLPGIGRALFANTLRIGSRNLSREQIDETYDNFHATARAQVLRLYRATDPARFAGWEDELLALAKRVPLRVIWGEHDPFIERRFADRFGSTDVHRIAEAGHWVASEAPDRVASLVAEHCG